MLDIELPFGPPIGTAQAPESHVKYVNQFVEIAELQGYVKELDYSENLVGRVYQQLEFIETPPSTEFLATTAYLKALAEKFADIALARRLQVTELLPSYRHEVRDWAAWVVRQKEGDYNPLHSHLKFDVTGVFYTNVPKSIQEHDQPTEGCPDGAIEFSYGSDDKFSPGRFRITPEPGLILLFPAFTYHVVYPFREDPGERICLSFNASFQR